MEEHGLLDGGAIGGGCSAAQLALVKNSFDAGFKLAANADGRSAVEVLPGYIIAGSIGPPRWISAAVGISRRVRASITALHWISGTSQRGIGEVECRRR